MGEPAPQPTPRERAELHFEDWARRLADAEPYRLSAETIEAAANLADTDAEAYDAFCTGVVNEVIASRLRSHLARFRHAAMHRERATSLRRFHDDTRAATEADEEPPSPFDGSYALPGSHTWYRLGAMRRPDLLAVSRHRSGLARSNAIESVFLAAVAAQLPDDETTVSEAITAEDILNLHAKAEHADLGELPLHDTDDSERDHDDDR